MIYTARFVRVPGKPYGRLVGPCVPSRINSAPKPEPLTPFSSIDPEIVRDINGPELRRHPCDVLNEKLGKAFEARADALKAIEDSFDEGDICEVLDFVALPSPAQERAPTPEPPAPTRVTAEEVQEALHEAVEVCKTNDFAVCAAYWDAAEEVFHAYKRQAEHELVRQDPRSAREERVYDL
jgi:hypothetical protein